MRFHEGLLGLGAALQVGLLFTCPDYKHVILKVCKSSVADTQTGRRSYFGCFLFVGLTASRQEAGGRSAARWPVADGGSTCWKVQWLHTDEPESPEETEHPLEQGGGQRIELNWIIPALNNSSAAVTTARGNNTPERLHSAEVQLTSQLITHPFKNIFHSRFESGNTWKQVSVMILNFGPSPPVCSERPCLIHSFLWMMKSEIKRNTLIVPSSV